MIAGSPANRLVGKKVLMMDVGWKGTQKKQRRPDIWA